MSERTVLVISYFFPPTGGGGVQRTSKLVKYLPVFGWRPVVLTVKNSDFDAADVSLVEDLPEGVLIHRTRTFEPVRIYRELRRGKNSRYSYRETNPTEKATGGAGFPRSIFDSLIRAVKWFISTFILFPDDYIGWVPFAVARGVRVASEEGVDLIYATGKPWSSFFAAFVLAKLLRRPFILDLRDPWVITPYGGSPQGSLRRKLETFCERGLFRAAARVILVNEQIRDAYREVYPELPRDRFICITHGFDPSDFPSAIAPAAVSGSKMTITYAGTLHPPLNPGTFLEALAGLDGCDPAWRDRIAVRFIGIAPEPVKRLAAELGLSSQVEFAGYRPHKDAVMELVRSDVLLLLLESVGANSRAQISTGKLFEYLAARRPILALIPPETDAARLIGSTRAGVVVPMERVSEIREALTGLWSKFREGALKPHAADLDRYTRRRLARRAAFFFDSAVSPAPRPAVFFDRDGVLNELVERDGRPVSPRKASDFRISVDAEKSLKSLKDARFLCFAVTNQPDIARTLMDESELSRMHEILRRRLRLDDIRFCPHDDSDGCSCRKPRPGLILETADDWGIDPRNSFFIGDSWKDAEAARSAGCKVILLDRPYNQGVVSDHRVESLCAAAKIVKLSIET